LISLENTPKAASYQTSRSQKIYPEYSDFALSGRSASCRRQIDAGTPISPPAKRQVSDICFQKHAILLTKL
jgi:hypothetical protein